MTREEEILRSAAVPDCEGFIIPDVLSNDLINKLRSLKYTIIQYSDGSWKAIRPKGSKYVNSAGNT